MSMPERIWRIVRGRWLVAEERQLEFRAEQQAVEELNEALATSSPAPSRLPRNPDAWRPAYSPSALGPKSPVQHPKFKDPLAEDLALLDAPPACDIATLERLYAERLAALGLDQLPPGSPEHTRAVARRASLFEAYERLRDAINITETRFEKLEF